MKSISSAFASFRAYWPKTYLFWWMTLARDLALRLFA